MANEPDVSLDSSDDDIAIVNHSRVEKGIDTSKSAQFNGCEADIEKGT